MTQNHPEGFFFPSYAPEKTDCRVDGDLSSCKGINCFHSERGFQFTKIVSYAVKEMSEGK